MRSITDCQLENAGKRKHLSGTRTYSGMRDPTTEELGCPFKVNPAAAKRMHERTDVSNILAPAWLAALADAINVVIRVVRLLHEAADLLVTGLAGHFQTSLLK